jgi:Penicillin-insensitive murein endopeptidase
MSWRREEVWLDADLLWFDEGGGAAAVAAFVLPPLPSFGPYGLAASRLRREAWKRRRRARATALMLLPTVLVPPAALRSGGAASASAALVVDDPPSLSFRVASPRKERPRVDRARPVSPTIEWRNATSIGLWWSGSLVEGTQLPLEGSDWVTWNPVTDSVPNAPRRLYGNERTIRTVVSVIEAYRAANPDAPRVVVGDISFQDGGPMDAHVSHQNGLDVDIYYPRLDRALRAPRSPSAVDRRLSQDLLDRFIAAGATMVFVGYHTGVHGPSKVVIPYPNHENHMHVRFPRR